MGRLWGWQQGWGLLPWREGSCWNRILSEWWARHLVPQVMLLLVGVQTGSSAEPGRQLCMKDKGWTSVLSSEGL